MSEIFLTDTFTSVDCEESVNFGQKSVEFKEGKLKKVKIRVTPFETFVAKLFKIRLNFFEYMILKRKN